MINTLVARSKLKQLISLLAEEHDLLLNGPLSDLEPVVQRRDIVLKSMIEGDPVSKRFLDESLPEIRDLAARNTTLLEASIEGMRAARATLKAMQENFGDLETYTPNGKRLKTARPDPQKGKRV